MDKSDNKNVKNKEDLKKAEYKGHRERIRKRFLDKGIHSFSDYEILEFLLFYCNAQGDTKPIAKAILKKFKSLNRVFKADVKELKTVEGVGPISAILIKFIGELLTELYGENLKIETKADKITDKEALLKFLRNKIGYEDVEKFYVIYLSSSNEVIAFEESSSGTLDRSSIYPREIYKRVIMENAKSIIIAHNHPSGNTRPSKCDIDITNEIAKGLKNFGALLLEHIIITRDSYFSFLEEGLI
ncbi:DNA repair protein RadC [Fusobacterium pseudoperiodonticum]